MTNLAATLIFDGDCGFCTRCVIWGTSKLSAFPNPKAFQTIDPASQGLTDKDVRESVWLISGTTVLSGARAVAWILKQQKNLGWRALGSFIDCYPVRPLAKFGYRLVAKNRHRLPGASTSCKIVSTNE